MDNLAAGAIQVPIPPDAGKRKSARPGRHRGRYEWMRKALSTQLGRRLSRTRSQTAEPTFAHTKHNRGTSRFHRRGRPAARTQTAPEHRHPQPDQAPPPHPGPRNDVNRGPSAPPHRNRPGRRRPRPPAGFRDSLDEQEVCVPSPSSPPLPGGKQQSCASGANGV
jgi:Transposase DDE domain